MGIQKNIPNIKPGDWTSVRQVISRLALRIGPESTPTFSGLILTNPLGVPYGGTGAVTLTDHGILLGSGTGAITPLGVATNGQLPIGSTGADPVLATITGTANQIIVTNGAGSITLSTPQAIGTGSSPTFAGLTLTDLTASRLMATNGDKQLVSSDLVNWVTGTANQITVTDDADGTITLSTPQNIHVSATPQFDTVTVTNKFKLGGGAIIEYDSESGNIPLKLSDDAGASIIDIQDSASNTVAYIDSDGDALFGNTFALSLETNSLTVNGVAVATGFTIGANTLDTNEFGYLDGQNQHVKTSSSPTFVGATIPTINGVTTLTFNLGQDYIIKERSNTLAFQGQTSGIGSIYEFFSKDGDGTDNMAFQMFGKGTPQSIDPYELLAIGYIASDTTFRIYTAAAGVGGNVRALKLYTGANTSQLVLSTDGNNSMSGNLDVGGVYKVDNVQVIGNQQAHIADATTQDLTGTDTIDQTKLESDLAGIVAAIAALNLMAETHGLIASS